MMSENNVNTINHYSAKNTFVNYFLLVFFIAFPLFETDSYANIRHDKFYLFLGLSAVFVAAEIPALLLSFRKSSEKVSDFFRKLSFTDYAFTALTVIFAVSTLSSDYIFDSFLGVSGRFCGLLSFIVFYILYLIISRNYYFKEYVFVCFSAALLAVYILAILNSFGIDPLGMYTDYSQEVRNDFLSTIGNKNIMSSLCCVSAPAIFVLFIRLKTPLRFLYLLTSICGVFTMIRCDSSSGYLGFAAVVILLSLYYTKKSEKPFVNRIFWILLGIYCALILVAVALFIYFTFIDTSTRLFGFMKYFRFDEKWGTHRGFIWLKSFEAFKGFNLKSVMLGSGTDTFYNVFQPYFAELEARFGDSLNNSAHNELLNYLITTGALGLLSYLSLIVFAVIRALKAARKNILALAFIAPVVCYFSQSVVNVSSIITLPFLFIFISLAENISRKELSVSV